MWMRSYVLKKQFRIVAVFSVLSILQFLGPCLAFADERGGVSGAEFLNMSPTPRYNSMGGVLDGLGDGLEGIHYNPAVLSKLESLSLQLNVNPYPNDVSHDQVSFGLPLLGGVGAVSVQMLNTGGFTYVNENLQPEETYSVYDTAASFGYSRYIWSTLSAGASIKTIYRVLGEYTAFAAGADAGVAYWFETPHFGQRPKPPPQKKLEKVYLSEKKLLDIEREKRIREAERKVDVLRKHIEEIEAEEENIARKREEAAGEKSAPLEEKQTILRAEINELHLELLQEEENVRKSIAQTEEWYSTQLQKAQDAYSKKLTDLAFVESERGRLFSLINDPDRELTDEIIDSYIDDTILKMNSFLAERRTSLQTAYEVYRERRLGRAEEIREEINAYEKQIEDEIGAKKEALQGEIDALKKELEQFAAQENEAAQDMVSSLQKKISEKEAGLLSLGDNPWVHRLESRVREKEKQIGEIESDIPEKEREMQKAIEEIAQTIQKDLVEFEALREWIKRELKKAKLKRELDLLKARKEHRQKNALRNYKESEKELYLRLLEVMYEYENNMLKAQISAVMEDFENRSFDNSIDLQKEKERLEQEFAFQQRYQSMKISEIERNAGKPQNGDEEKKQELAAVKAELNQMEVSYAKRMEEMKKEEKESLSKQQVTLEKKISELEWQIELMQLVYLQTDTPYRNTSVHMSIQNIGTQVKFVEEGYPLPTNFSVGVGYAVLNTNNHAVKLGTQLNLPFYNTVSVGVGAEYGFLDTVFVRAGYCFGSLNRSVSVGLGATMNIGFARYAVDYSFQPLPEYGVLHSFGVSARF